MPIPVGIWTYRIPGVPRHLATGSNNFRPPWIMPHLYIKQYHNTYRALSLYNTSIHIIILSMMSGLNLEQLCTFNNIFNYKLIYTMSCKLCRSNNHIKYRDPTPNIFSFICKKSLICWQTVKLFQIKHFPPTSHHCGLRKTFPFYSNILDTIKAAPSSEQVGGVMDFL